MNKIKNVPKQIIIKAVLLILMILCIGLMITMNARGETTEEIIQYNYTAEERKLADEVLNYLNGYIVLGENESGRIADAAVQSYHTIIDSGVKDVSDEHTIALVQRMEHALRAEITAEQVTEEGVTALADGICTLIWDAVLAQLETEDESENNEESKILLDSIQKQVDELKKKNMSVKISANIKGNGVSKEELEKRDSSILAQIGDKLSEFKDNIMKEAETKYGEFKDGKDGRDGINGQNGTSGKDGSSGKDGDDGKNGDDGRDGKDGRDGAEGKHGIDGKDGDDGDDGKTGDDGKDGEAGTDGKDGADGKDGLSTYYMFSAYPNGREGGAEDGEVSMTLDQSNTTKYIGIAHTDNLEVPEAPEAYSWSEYKDYIIFSEPDEAGVQTVYIQ